MNKTTTIVNAAQKTENKKPVSKPRWKWSGEDDEPSWNDDKDGITYRQKWYDAHNHDGHDWDNQWG
jgi:hypothetical protein